MKSKVRHPYSWRARKTRFAILVTGLVFAALLLPGTANAHASNCQIRIDVVKRNGEKEKQSFKTHLDSQKQCATLAKIHKPNFNPELIAKKSVTYRWLR